MADIRMVALWTLFLLVLPVHSKKCHRVQIPEDWPMTIPLHKSNNKGGRLEASFIFHSPLTAKSTWLLNITLTPQDVYKSVKEVILLHSEDEDEFLVALCDKDSRADWTIIPSPWSHTSRLTFSRNITLQADSEHILINETTGDHNNKSTMILEHNCSVPLQDTPQHLDLLVMCGGGSTCGEVEYCLHDCHILKPPQTHSPLKLELQASNEEQQITAHFHHHPPSNPYNNNNNNNDDDDDNDNSWFLMLAFTPPNKVINWIASVAMIHSQFPGQSEYGDRLQIKCNTAIEEESNTEERSDTTATKSDWYPNQPNATLFAIRIVIGSADIQVLNSTTEQDFEMVHHKCLGPLEHFPNLTVTVACFPGNTECGSVNNCSNTGCRMVNVTVKRARLDHWIREDGKVETEASFQPPRFNTSWITILTFTVPGNETVIVASVTMFHLPGLEDSLHVRCTSIMGNNDKYNDTRKDNKNDTSIVQQWTNSQKIPFRGVKIQIGSSYLQMIDTTTGKNTEMGNISCSFAQYFPNITMNVICVRGSCGHVSICNFTENEMFKIPPRPRSLLDKLVVLMDIVGVMISLGFACLLTHLWLRYIDVNILHHLSPLLPACLRPTND
ncbi:hypothetical protein Pcinc_020539 [Petrolisthes cinctipes]|uniref:Uncharacterized protein n=1 Tax=Petrolisthes cinctipes TaxID=88211 RepID=A0AAE1FIZ0_PETCI|nr:hypothetical protein Pcinc_020539 [Petrolisthes cinctipes]